MFKLVVLCAFLAAAAAEPSVRILSPVAYTTSVVAPATTTISRQASSVVHPSPVFYSTPVAYSHFIKKRSAPLALSSYIAPATYFSAAPVATTYSYSAPIVHAAPLISSPLAHFAYPAAHLIKKRSAVPFAYQATYFTPTTYASRPIFASTYAAPAPIYSSHLVSTPITYSHLIKKRSAVATYLAPTSYSSQSRIDYHGTPAITTYSFPAPVTYSHVF